MELGFFLAQLSDVCFQRIPILVKGFQAGLGFFKPLLKQAKRFGGLFFLTAGFIDLFFQCIQFSAYFVAFLLHTCRVAHTALRPGGLAGIQGEHGQHKAKPPTGRTNQP